METFCSCVIVIVIIICNKIWPNYNYFCLQQLHRIRDNAEKQNHCHTWFAFVIFVEISYLNTYMCKLELLKKEENRDLSADSN